VLDLKTKTLIGYDSLLSKQSDKSDRYFKLLFSFIITFLKTVSSLDNAALDNISFQCEILREVQQQDNDCVSNNF
jgi:hypothetical protein